MFYNTKIRSLFVIIYVLQHIFEHFAQIAICVQKYIYRIVNKC